MRKLLTLLILSGAMLLLASCVNGQDTEDMLTEEPFFEETVKDSEVTTINEKAEEKMAENEIITDSSSTSSTSGNGVKVLNASDFPEAKTIDSIEGKELNEFDTIDKTAEVFFEAGAKIRSAILENEGILYFGNEDCEFYAVDINTKQQLWKYKTDDSVQNLPVFSDGMILFNAGNSLYALNSENGGEIFKVTHTTDSTKRLSHEDYTYNDTSAAVSNGFAYYIALNGDLVAVDITKGEISWVIPASIEGSAGSGVNFYNGKLYWVDNGGILCCADSNTHEMVFTLNIKDKIYAPMLINDGKIYIAGRSCKIYCVDSESGDLIWSSFTDDKTTWLSGGSVCVGDTVFTGASDKCALFSYDKNTGEFNRMYYTKGNVYTAPALNGNNVIIAATDVYSLKKSYIMEFDTENHTKLWQTFIEDGVLSSPVVYEGSVYFGSDSGVVYSIDLK